MGANFSSSGQVEQSGSGTIVALSGAVTIPLPGASSLLLSISGTWGATLVFEISSSDGVWVACPALSLPSFSSTLSTTANGIFGFGVGGYASFRVRSSLFTSGTVTVSYNWDSNQNPFLAPSFLHGGTDGILIGNSGTSLLTSVTASVLPAGASTSALQTTGNASLSSIDTKTPALGQAPAAASTPVVLTAAQLTTLTPLSSVTANQGTQGTSTSPWYTNLRTSAGTEITALNAQIQTADILNAAGAEGAITVGTSAILANVSGTNRANRKFVSVFNNGNVTIYYGFSSGVTTSSGTPIFKNQFLTFAVSANANVYLISGTASQNVRITEGV